MDKRTKQGLVAVALLVLVGTVATVASGQEYAPAYAQQYARLGAPTVVGIAAFVDLNSNNRIRVYRAWSDGYVDNCYKLNGGEDYNDWFPVE